MNKIINFNIACPKYGKQVISLNNVGKWLRYQQSKIKNEYKDNLKEFCIPKPIKKYKDLFIVFRIYRNNKRILDSDAIGFIIKWTIDAIKEEGWLIDDDQITYIVFPSILDRNLIESEINVSVYEKIEDFSKI